MRRVFVIFGLCAGMLLGSSCETKEPPRAEYLSVAQLEQRYGRLITLANAPTPDQNGTGDLLGLFQDEDGTVWGIPLVVNSDATLLGCAPPGLREVSVSDTLPADLVEIIGAANTPTGWRGGTGELGLVIRKRPRPSSLALSTIDTGDNWAGMPVQIAASANPETLSPRQGSFRTLSHVSRAGIEKLLTG